MTKVSTISHSGQTYPLISKWADMASRWSSGMTSPHVIQVMRGILDALKIKSGKVFSDIFLLRFGLKKDLSKHKLPAPNDLKETLLEINP